MCWSHINRSPQVDAARLAELWTLGLEVVALIRALVLAVHEVVLLPQNQTLHLTIIFLTSLLWHLQAVRIPTDHVATKS